MWASSGQVFLYVHLLSATLDYDAEVKERGGVSECSKEKEIRTHAHAKRRRGETERGKGKRETER